jgi:hypothetical protein
MKVFHVKFHGRHADWIGKGRAQSVGFYKKESVLAGEEDEAVPKALMRILAGLAERSQDIAIDPQRFELEVCDIAEDRRFWQLAYREKFDFYPIW